MKKIAILTSFLGILLCLSGCSKKNQTVNVAFFGLEPNIQKGIKTSLEKYSENQTSIYKINIVELGEADYSTENWLENQLCEKNISMLFTEAGWKVSEAVKTAEKINSGKKRIHLPELNTSLLSGMTTSMQKSAIIKEKTLSAIPVLINHLELNIELPSLRSSGREEILTWKDFEAFARQQAQHVQGPVLFGGEDSVFFLDFLGAVCESLDGTKNYEKAVEILREAEIASANAAAGEKMDYAEVVDKLVNYGDSPLYNTIVLLNSYYKKGLINQSSFNLKPKNLQLLFRAREQKLIFTTLSARRPFESKTMSAYLSIFVPSENAPGSRTFTANITYAIPVVQQKNKKANKAVCELAAAITSEELQENFSRSTGLAPANRTCRTPDVQAADVRYYIAATNPPLAGLGHEANLPASDLQKLCAELRTLIMYRK